jgi:hypothetical protein
MRDILLTYRRRDRARKLAAIGCLLAAISLVVALGPFVETEAGPSPRMVSFASLSVPAHHPHAARTPGWMNEPL